MNEIAKVFTTGRSQAVRIPKKYRFKSDRLIIKKQGDSIVLTPVKPCGWDEFFAHYTCPDFELDRAEAQKISERELF